MAAVTLDQTRRRLELEVDVLAAGANSGWIELPQDSNRAILIAWFPGASGTMTVEFTIDTLTTVRAGSPAALLIASASEDDGHDALPAGVTAVKFTATTDDGQYRVVA